MKGYYKNWYQHYLKVEAQKEQDMKRGYYSNLPTKEEKSEREQSEETQDDVNPVLRIQTIEPMRKKKRKRFLLNILLPVAMLAGFVFLWYQMDVGPIRYFANEALVLTGLREPAIDVSGYHTSLLDQHLEFAEKIASYINSEGTLDFSELELMLDDLREKHLQIIEISGESHAEVMRLWSLKMASTGQMMDDLMSDDQVDMTTNHEQFMLEQEEIAIMIMKELEV